MTKEGQSISSSGEFNIIAEFMRDPNYYPAHLVGEIISTAETLWSNLAPIDGSEWHVVSSWGDGHLVVFRPTVLSKTTTEGNLKGFVGLVPTTPVAEWAVEHVAEFDPGKVETLYFFSVRGRGEELFYKLWKAEALEPRLDSQRLGRANPGSKPPLQGLAKH